MENEVINNKILDVWNKFENESGEYLPILYPDFNKGGILFIGLNPSFSEKGFKKIFKNTEYQDINIRDKLSKKKSNIDQNFLIWETNKANQKGVYPYFARFHEISENLDLPYQHIDLFYFRETDQKKAKQKIAYNHTKKESLLNDFGQNQLEIVINIIENIMPKIIVVVNALASDIINTSHLFKINAHDFKQNGYDILEIKNNKFPILFSSMLTGQRALDNNSYRRLKRHIEKTIKNEEEK